MKTKTYLTAILFSALTFISTAQTEKLPLSVTVTVVNPTCAGFNNGQVILDISGGYMPYTFNGIQISGSQVTMGSLSQGTYSFLVEDISLASNSGNVTLTEPTAAQVSAIIGNASYQSNNGYVDVTVVCELPVTYAWSTLEPIQIPATDEDQFNLIAGIYDLTITDSNGCETPKRFTVGENSFFTTNPEVLSE